VVASEESGAPESAWGDTFFIYDPDRTTPPERQFPYATIVISDYPGFDEASNLNRPGGIQGEHVGRARHIRATDFNEGRIGDRLHSPRRGHSHPVYGAQSWLSVLNAGPATDETVKTLLVEAHDRAKVRYEKKRGKV
jgi:hypothetical protein